MGFLEVPNSNIITFLAFFKDTGRFQEPLVS